MIVPEVGLTEPIICETRVVLPDPFGPNKPNISPELTIKLILSLALTPLLKLITLSLPPLFSTHL